jgi:hypothetical protein
LDIIDGKQIKGAIEIDELTSVSTKMCLPICVNPDTIGGNCWNHHTTLSSGIVPTYYPDVHRWDCVGTGGWRISSNTAEHTYTKSDSIVVAICMSASDASFYIYMPVHLNFIVCFRDLIEPFCSVFYQIV